jgi:hypothetical protein
MNDYMHTANIEFEIVSEQEDGSDITPEIATEALVGYVDRLVAKGFVLSEMEIRANVSDTLVNFAHGVCRHSQPQEYIDLLESKIKYLTKEMDELDEQLAGWQ